MFTTFSAWVDLLFKAAGHKYIKRIPYTRGGKLRYRYIYKVTHTARGKHALHEDDVTVGAAFMLGTDRGSEVHAHVKSVDGDKVTVEYDDGPRKGEKETMSKRDLLSKLDAAHGISAALQSEREKQAKVLSELRASGASEKQIAREQARLDRLGAATQGHTDPVSIFADPAPTNDDSVRMRSLKEGAVLSFIDSLGERLTKDTGFKVTVERLSRDALRLSVDFNRARNTFADKTGNRTILAVKKTADLTEKVNNIKTIMASLENEAEVVAYVEADSAASVKKFEGEPYYVLGAYTNMSGDVRSRGARAQKRARTSRSGQNENLVYNIKLQGAVDAFMPRDWSRRISPQTEK